MISPPPRFTLLTPKDVSYSTGLAVRLMLDQPAFARLPFGTWAGIVDGQAKRGHQRFAVDERGQVVGYFGYALVTEADAEAWAAGRASLAHEACFAGDCVVFNAWVARTRAVHRFLWNEARAIGLGRTAAYYLRLYPDGRRRRVRLPANAFMTNHLAAASGSPTIVADAA